MPGFATGPLNVKKPFSILSLRPNAVYVEPGVTRTLPIARSGMFGALIAVIVPARPRSAPAPLKAELLPQIDVDIGARRERPDRLLAATTFWSLVLALHRAVGPHDHDVVAEARRGLFRQVEERVIDVELAVDRHAALHAARSRCVALPDSDSCRSGDANSSSLSAMMLAVRSGSLLVEPHLAGRAQRAARAVELDLLQIDEILGQRDPNDAVLQLHALIDDRRRKFVAR